MIVVLAAAAAVFFLWERGPVVPDVVGLTEIAAEAALEQEGLVAGEVVEQPAPGAAAGTVLAQDPPPGSTADEATAVNLVVVAAEVKVPDVVGLNRAQATALLEQEGLVVGVLSQTTSDQVTVGTVVRQDPAAGGAAMRGTAVSLVLAKAPTAGVPTVVGLPRGEAESVLTAAGFAVGSVTQQENANAEAGVVVNQDPEADSQVAPGTAVDLVVSTGSAAPSRVEVPSLVGLDHTEAFVALVDAGLQIGKISYAFSANAAAGLVTQQTPAAGGQVTRASLVDVVIVKGRAAGVVPDVAGLSQPDAASTLEAGGFTVAIERVVSGVTPGYVTDQSPASGSQAGAGATVTLEVSQGETADEKTQVPLLAGLDLSDALVAVSGADLVPRLLSVQSTRVGEVVGQDPTQDSEVVLGTPVTLRVGASKRPPQ